MCPPKASYLHHFRKHQPLALLTFSSFILLGRLNPRQGDRFLWVESYLLTSLGTCVNPGLQHARHLSHHTAVFPVPHPFPCVSMSAVCKCVCVPVCVFTCVCPYIMLGIVLDQSYALLRVSHSNPGLTDKASLSSQLALGIPSPPSKTGLRGRPTSAPDIYMSSAESKFWSSCLHSKCFNHQVISQDFFFFLSNTPATLCWFLSAALR